MRFAVPGTSAVVDVEPKQRRFVEGHSRPCDIKECDKVLTRATGHWSLNGCVGCSYDHCEMAVRRNASL